MKTLHQAFLHHLEQLYTAENELVRALPKMAKAAQDEALKAGFTEHLEQTKQHVLRLEEAAASLEAKLNGVKNPVVSVLLEEGEKVINSEGSSAVRDAALIAAAQQLEHYEIAAYGTTIAWAKAMEHDEVVDVLKKTLGEEEMTDKKLSTLAQGTLLKDGINEEAVEQA
jgi:ferritin-like metal-binding protein YciE